MYRMSSGHSLICRKVTENGTGCKISNTTRKRPQKNDLNLHLLEKTRNTIYACQCVKHVFEHIMQKIAYINKTGWMTEISHTTKKRYITNSSIKQKNVTNYHSHSSVSGK